MCCFAVVDSALNRSMTVFASGVESFGDRGVATRSRGRLDRRSEEAHEERELLLAPSVRLRNSSRSSICSMSPIDLGEGGRRTQQCRKSHEWPQKFVVCHG